jgi:hypothetical protein
MGRAAQGVRVVKLHEGDYVSDVVRVVDEEWFVILFLFRRYSLKNFLCADAHCKIFVTSSRTKNNPKLVLEKIIQN